MEWIEAKIIYDPRNESIDIVEDLIASVFYDLGLKGVWTEQPFLPPPVEGWGDDAVDPPDHFAVIGYLPHNEHLTEKKFTLESLMAGFNQRHDLTIGHQILYRQIDEEDWAESWKIHFHPQRITERIVIKPTWEDFTPKANDMIIEIDPGMAFGTGTHPTTALCLAMLEKYVRQGDTVLDVGTGSGILMVCAAKLGAMTIKGTDNDPVAVAISRDNLLRNHVSCDRFQVDQGDLVRDIREPVDVVAANILSEVIVTLLDDIHRVLRPGGILICSGIIAENKSKVTDKLAQTGLEPLEIEEKESWVAIAAKRSR